MQCFISVQSPLSSLMGPTLVSRDIWKRGCLLSHCALTKDKGKTVVHRGHALASLSVGQGLLWCITTCMQGLCGSRGHSTTHFGLCPGFFRPKNFLCTVYYITVMCYDCLQGCELKFNEFLSKRCCENKCNSSSLLSSPRSSFLCPPCV